MDKATYSLISGIALLAAALVFFILPAVANMDAFIPVLVAIVLLGLALITLISGYGAVDGRR